MQTFLRKHVYLLLFLTGCATANRQSPGLPQEVSIDAQPVISADEKPASLMDLPQSQDGGFVLATGFYEAEFKTYCLQPGTPDPSAGDAYLQAPVSGHRKEIVESVLLNSAKYPSIPQRNVQLLLWSIVSGSNYDKLPSVVKADASKLLTPKQVFQLRGGIAGLVKTISSTSGMLRVNNDMQHLFESGISSYERFEQLAVLPEASQIKKKGVKADQWYKQKENYYIRYVPINYQRVKIQVYVPEGLLDREGKLNGEHILFDPTGQQAVPAFTNAQRLGIGSPVIAMVRVIIQMNKKQPAPKQLPPKKKKEETPTKQLT